MTTKKIASTPKDCASFGAIPAELELKESFLIAVSVGLWLF